MLDMSTFLIILKTIFILIAVIFLANFLLRLANSQLKRSNKMINIIERVQLNNTSSLNVVEICGEYYLMSSTDKSNELLKELDKAEVERILEMKDYTKDQDHVNIKSFIDTLKRGKES